LKGPELALLLGDVVFGDLLRFGPRGFRALGDPPRDDRDFLVRELFALGRHLAVPDLGHHLAFIRVARNHDAIAILRELFHEPPEPEIHAALQLLAFAMAAEAVLLQDGAHILFKSQRTKLRVRRDRGRNRRPRIRGRRVVERRARGKGHCQGSEKG